MNVSNVSHKTGSYLSGGISEIEFSENSSSQNAYSQDILIARLFSQAISSELNEDEKKTAIEEILSILSPEDLEPLCYTLCYHTDPLTSIEILRYCNDSLWEEIGKTFLKPLIVYSFTEVIFNWICKCLHQKWEFKDQSLFLDKLFSTLSPEDKKNMLAYFVIYSTEEESDLFFKNTSKILKNEIRKLNEEIHTWGASVLALGEEKDIPFQENTRLLFIDWFILKALNEKNSYLIALCFTQNDWNWAKSRFQQWKQPFIHFIGHCISTITAQEIKNPSSPRLHKQRMGYFYRNICACLAKNRENYKALVKECFLSFTPQILWEYREALPDALLSYILIEMGTKTPLKIAEWLNFCDPSEAARLFKLAQEADILQSVILLIFSQDPSLSTNDHSISLMIRTYCAISTRHQKEVYERMFLSSKSANIFYDQWEKFCKNNQEYAKLLQQKDPFLKSIRAQKKIRACILETNFSHQKLHDLIQSSHLQESISPLWLYSLFNFLDQEMWPVVFMHFPTEPLSLVGILNEPSWVNLATKTLSLIPQNPYLQEKDMRVASFSGLYQASCHHSTDTIHSIIKKFIEMKLPHLFFQVMDLLHTSSWFSQNENQLTLMAVSSLQAANVDQEEYIAWALKSSLENKEPDTIRKKIWICLFAENIERKQATSLKLIEISKRDFVRHFVNNKDSISLYIESLKSDQNQSLNLFRYWQESLYELSLPDNTKLLIFQGLCCVFFDMGFNLKSFFSYIKDENPIRQWHSDQTFFTQNNLTLHLAELFLFHRFNPEGCLEFLERNILGSFERDELFNANFEGLLIALDKIQLKVEILNKLSPSLRDVIKKKYEEELFSFLTTAPMHSSLMVRELVPNWKALLLRKIEKIIIDSQTGPASQSKRSCYQPILELYGGLDKAEALDDFITFLKNEIVPDLLSEVDSIYAIFCAKNPHRSLTILTVMGGVLNNAMRSTVHNVGQSPITKVVKGVINNALKSTIHSVGQSSITNVAREAISHAVIGANIEQANITNIAKGALNTVFNSFYFGTEKKS